ncbi:MAG: hypothetical protein ACOC5T_01650 [Elusimicrobiota bacterium]
MRYIIDKDDVPEEIEAENYKEASEKVMELISIISQEDWDKAQGDS